VRTREEILKAQGSKYCPTPILTLISKILEDEGPVAFIGLGCHVHGLHNVMELFPELRRKVGPIIGLVCDRILTYGAIDYLLWRGKVSEGEPVSLQYRSKELNGYPGDVRIGRKGETPVFLPKRERTQIKDFYTPARCRLCFDKMNVLSDLTFGDPHGMPDTDTKDGDSLVIVRTPVGRDALDGTIESGHLELRKALRENVLFGQAIEDKKKAFSGYCSKWLSMGRFLPTQAATVHAKIPALSTAWDKGEDIDLALALDSFASRMAMVRSTRKWLKRRSRIKKIGRIRRSLFKRLGPSGEI
jgi:coenzyme F420 hydrogenase subunit beta